jgi:hypothetical protein
MSDLAPDIEYDDFGVICTNLWSRLARQIESAIPDAYIEGGPEKAMHFAQCAEACFWAARGESESETATKIVSRYLENAKAKSP